MSLVPSTSSSATSLPWGVVLDPSRETAPLVELSGEFKLVSDFDRRFPEGPPSLIEAERLTVEGDVTFGADVVVRGVARVDGPATIADGEVLPPG